MNRPERSRRSILVAGAATGAALVAGCTEGTGEGDEGGDENGDDDQLEDEADEAADEPIESDEWEDVDAIELEGTTDDGWIGRQPSAIENEENPTLVLLEGQEYEITWINGDGDVHNLAIADEEGTALEATEFTENEDETERLSLEATDEQSMYLCETHGDEMVGSIEVRSG